ncbi:DUF4012 domain-containing protein [Microgenomates group bacterium]|nr:DUF4012 domain-containing protein [Microgenomates group bacterium]
MINSQAQKPRAKNKSTIPSGGKFLPLWWHKLLFGLGIFFLFLIVVGSVFAYHYGRVAARLENSGFILMASATELLDELKAQNIPTASDKITVVTANYHQFRAHYNQLLPLKFLPRYGAFIADGQIALESLDHALTAAQEGISALMPYTDLLGFAGEGSFSGGTTEDRIKNILETLGEMGPQLDAIGSELEQLQLGIEQIDASKYPDQFNDYFAVKFMSLFSKRIKKYAQLPIRELLEANLSLADATLLTFAQYRPVIDLLPEMMGANGQDKTYLVLFQNDNELRPTGGFLTAYSIITVQDGKITPAFSDDIYELDRKFNQRIPIPEKLGKYLITERYWNLRDMNIDPDFQASMELFMEHYLSIPSEPKNLDGVIALDTKVLTDLIDVLGPVEVAGYGTFTTEPDAKYTDAPQVVVALSEIITRPVNYIKTDRKGILGPMMKAILQKVYEAPKEQLAPLFSVVLSNLEGRHIQAYFPEERFQEAVETIGVAGRLALPTTPNTDFLAVVDANLGGAKSNLFISSSALQEIEEPDLTTFTLTKKLTLTYVNSRPGDNCNLEAGLLCLNGTNNNWQRLYLPAGAELISAQGYKSQPEIYSEKGFTVIDGFFSLDPEKTARVILEYTIPYSDPDTYRLQIWKQGGVDSVRHLLNVNGGEEELDVSKDTLFTTTFN